MMHPASINVQYSFYTVETFKSKQGKLEERRTFQKVEKVEYMAQSREHLKQ